VGLYLQDPLGFSLPLPLKAQFYPIGQPLLIETNCKEVLATANRLWSGWPKRNEDAPPVRFRISVSDSDSSTPLKPAMPSGQGHLLSVVHSAENFAIADVAHSFAFARLTRDVARDAAYFRYHFLDLIVWHLVDASHSTLLHASCVAIHGRAVVLCGDSGAGKTSLAYACARRGWSYLSDDVTHVLRAREPLTVAGRPFFIRFREAARQIFPELEAFTPERRLNGKLDIEVPTGKINIPIALESAASHVVFLDRRTRSERAGETVSVRQYPRPLAYARLRQVIYHGDERVQTEQNQTMDRLLELPTVEMTWHDFAGAEASLRSLVEAGE
jgi:hypothetical protein